MQFMWKLEKDIRCPTLSLSSYSPEAGSLTEPQARLVARKPQESSCLMPLKFHAGTVQSCLNIYVFELRSLCS